MSCILIAVCVLTLEFGHHEADGTEVFPGGGDIVGRLLGCAGLSAEFIETVPVDLPVFAHSSVAQLIDDLYQFVDEFFVRRTIATYVRTTPKMSAVELEAARPRRRNASPRLLCRLRLPQSAWPKPESIVRLRKDPWSPA